VVTWFACGEWVVAAVRGIVAGSGQRVPSAQVALDRGASGWSLKGLAVSLRSEARNEKLIDIFGALLPAWGSFSIAPDGSRPVECSDGYGWEDSA